MADYLDTLSSSSSAPPTFWCKLLPRKINLFLWRARRSFLPSLLQLAIKGITVRSISCPLCGDAIEDTDHALFKCLLPRRVWEAIGRWWGVCSISLWDCDEVLQLLPPAARPFWAAVLYVAAWAIWKAQNEFMMKNKPWSLLQVFSNIQVLSHLWVSSRSAKFVHSLSDWFLNLQNLFF